MSLLVLTAYSGHSVLERVAMATDIYFCKDFSFSNVKLFSVKQLFSVFFMHNYSL